MNRSFWGTSRARVHETPKRKGRPPRLVAGRQALSSARQYGIDLGLIQSALARTPAERLAMLEANSLPAGDAEEAEVSFASMLGGLIAGKVRFIVVGGLAAAAHGSSRVTNDLDICYDALDGANLVALARLLASWKAYPRGVETGLPFIMDDRTLRGAPILTLTSSEGDIDVMDRIAGVGPYADVRKHSERLPPSA